MLNYGGFTPVSTVDWRGRSVCVLFFRGCPVHCDYCHNETIRTGNDYRNLDEIIEKIDTSKMVVSGVVFSGGEPTCQPESLITLARAAKIMGLQTGIHTNGINPDVIAELIDRRLIDRVALDIKTQWSRYNIRLGADCVDKVKKSLSHCKSANRAGLLKEFQVVITVFRGFETEVPRIASEVGDSAIVLQQGVAKGLRTISEDEFKDIADKLDRPVWIRTREGGEIAYQKENVKQT
jgi:pyruvate formate lyase activating enzyme